MKLYKIEPGTFKLDGGATFGVVPKKLWEKQYPADENNLCTFALRSLIIEVNGRIILIDTGIGNKQEEKFFKHYHREGHHDIAKSVREVGFEPGQVTDIVLTHMHFDHVGGVMKYDKKGELVPEFTNATIHVSKQQWDWALNPNQREKASYLNENFTSIPKGKINFIESGTELVPGVNLRLFHGHTDGLIVPFIRYQDKVLVYTGDLFAMSPHIGASWVCGYDTRPLLSFDEKEKFLNEAVENGYYLIFQHDMYTETCSLIKTEKGIKVDKTFKLEELL